MKKYAAYISLTFFLLFFQACDKEGTFNSTFVRSLATWEEAKKLWSDSYTYTSESSSVFGFGSITQITVINGEVTRRDYEAYTIDQETQERTITDSWTEEGEQLNTHEEGAPTLTMDEIYGQCQNDILTVNTDENVITFVAGNQGILSVCTYFSKNCADDCSIGFNITSISGLN